MQRLLGPPVLALALVCGSSLAAQQAAVERFFPGLEWERPGVLSVDPVAPGSQVRITPALMPADSDVGPIRLQIDIGDQGMAADRAVVIRLTDAGGFSLADTDYSATSDPPLSGLLITLGPRQLRISAQTDWPAHTKLDVRITAQAGSPPLYTPQAANPQLFWIFRQTAAGDDFEQFPTMGGVVHPGPPRRLLVTLPSLAAVGTTVVARVAVLDSRDNPAPGWVDAVRLREPGGSLVAMPRGALANGYAQVPIRLPQRTGAFELVAESAGLEAGRSNPLLLLEASVLGDRQLLWGDLQNHSRRSSEGGGALRALVWRAAAWGVVDVLAATDHDRLVSMPGTDRFWRDSIMEIDRPAPLRPLLVLPGWEWTRVFEFPNDPGVKGHRCVLAADSASLLPVRSSAEAAWDSLGELLPDLATRPGRVVAIPHHLRHYYWDDADGADPALLADLAPVAEVLSRKGNYEEDDGGAWRHPEGIGGRGPFAGLGWLDGLQKGARAGAIGGSDSHVQYGTLYVRPAAGVFSRSADYPVVRPRRDTALRWLWRRGSMTALLVGDPSRDAVIGALQDRACYASSGPQTVLWYTVNGAAMGKEIAWDGGPVTLKGQVAASTPILSIEVRRVIPGGSSLVPVYTGYTSDRRHVDFHWVDAAPPAEPWVAYYVRVRVQGYAFDDGEILPEERAIGSPVWLVR